MAITNAQQAKQLLANGGMSLQEAKDMAPKGEFLAYINPKEAKMLKAAGGSGIMTKAGIPSFVEYGGAEATAGAAAGGEFGGGSPDDTFGGGDGRDPSKQFINTPPLTDKSRKALEDQRREARYQITPSTRPRNRFISGLLNIFSPIPFAGYGFNKAIDSTAMGFNTPTTDDDDDDDDKGGFGDNTENMMAQKFTPYQEDLIEDKEEELGPIARAIRERDLTGGARLFAAEGGIMDLEQAREGYKFGKLVKKIGRTIKKIGKSKVGKAALAAAATFKLGGGSFGDLIRNKSLIDSGFEFSNIGDRLGSFLPSDNKDRLALAASAGLVAAPFIFGEDDTEDEYQKFLASRGASGQGFDIQGIRDRPYDVLGRAFVAEGGKPEPVAKKTMPLLDMGGKEMDLRDNGGFVPIGRMEKADDVPARLSKNEFVFTADAVRNAGDGNVDKGAEVMYNMMKNLEAGGDVSEESQGLEGAKKMFQTSQRLEEVL